MTETRASRSRAAPLNALASNSIATHTTDPTDDSPLPEDDLTDLSASEDDGEKAKSTLYVALLASATSPGAFNEDAISEENIPVQNNPRPLRAQMGDKAEYWVDGNGVLLRLKFVARFDFHGQFSRVGPYFSMPDSGLDVASLRRARAHYEIHFLSPNDPDSHDYPQEAMDMSRRLLDTLSALTTEIEDVRNANVPEGERPALSPFLRAYTRNAQDDFVLLIQSEPLFRDLPNESLGGTTVPRVSRRDIGKSGVLLSPSKAKQGSRNPHGPPSPGGSSSSAAPQYLRIRDLPDPDNRYSGLGALRDTKVECPEVRDAHGVLIHPCEYGTKLAGARFVEVEVYLKLWHISPSRRADATDREKYGLRNYQIMLRKMQLLPKAIDGLRSAFKGKRKASEEPSGQPSNKKTADGTDEDLMME